MIRIKRISPPEIFTRRNGPADKEKKKAEEYYSAAELPEESFKFKFYSAYKDQYKDDLLKMFNSRCAYCECFVTVGGRGDIEHFRPKGECTALDSKVVRPGYYWLAADWDNLYLSCTNCNQSTTFKILDANNPGEIIEKSAEIWRDMTPAERSGCGDPQRSARLLRNRLNIVLGLLNGTRYLAYVPMKAYAGFG